MTAPVPSALIPHRPPFLFIDEVVEWAPDRIKTRSTVDPESPYLAGHYPGFPIMPGVLLCECCLQSGAALIAYRNADPSDPSGAVGRPVVTRIRDARFRTIVRPGDLLEIDVSLDDQLDDAYYLTGRVTVAGTPALRIQFTCKIINVSEFNRELSGS